MRKAKIVCTLGPSTPDVDSVVRLIEAGMDVARINFSHGDHVRHRTLFNIVRQAADVTGRPVAILGDLCGPKIRTGPALNGAFVIEDGQTITLSPGDFVGTPERISHSYPPLARDIRLGHPILINDGLLRLTVEAIQGEDVVCTVEAGGTVSDRKGINLPQTAILVPALSDKDIEDTALAVELGFDFLALSFVRTANDIHEAKKLAGSIPVLAKIEKPEALRNLEAILQAADGAMVARGDLGVELGHEKVPLAQKQVIAAIRHLAKPVITATQMLESMIQQVTPTRAEVSDVANAVLDGTDAVMLSGETSVGRHPALVVATMARIINEVETEATPAVCPGEVKISDESFSSMIAEAVTAAAREYGLAAMAVYTESGRSAALVSAQRPPAHIIAFTRHDEVLRRMSLLWGIKPLHGDWVKGVEGVVEQAEHRLLKRGLVKAGDKIAVTFGIRLGGEPFQTNMLYLWNVRSDLAAHLKRNTTLPIR